MSAQSVDSRRLGRSSQSAAIETVDGIEPVPDEVAIHHDARAIDRITPSPSLPIVGRVEIEPGTPIEIKSAAVVATADQKRGRFYLRREQHEKLIEQGAVYLMVVSTSDPSREVLAAKIVDAREIDDLVPSWIDGGDRADFAQITWSRVIEPSLVESRSV